MEKKGQPWPDLVKPEQTCSRLLLASGRKKKRKRGGGLEERKTRCERVAKKTTKGPGPPKGKSR